MLSSLFCCARLSHIILQESMLIKHTFSCSILNSRSYSVSVCQQLWELREQIAIFELIGIWVTTIVYNAQQGGLLYYHSDNSHNRKNIYFHCGFLNFLSFAQLPLSRSWEMPGSSLVFAQSHLTKVHHFSLLCHFIILTDTYWHIIMASTEICPETTNTSQPRLVVRLIQARELIKSDFDSENDTYAVITCGRQSFTSKVERTS